MPTRTFIEAIRATLADEMRRDESIIVLGEDVGKKGGVFLATDGLWAEFGDDRVIDTPLTESMIVGASIGAAVNGLRPVAEIQFADFIFPAFNQIVSEAALTDEISALVTDATDFAEAEPDPLPSSAMRWVYAEDWPSETPPPWGFGEPGQDVGPGGA